MSTLVILLGLLLAYLVGAIPTAVIVGRLKYGIDIRDHGSGNAGATNTFRVLGKRPGAFVMAIDVLKGFLATSIPLFFDNLDVTFSGQEIMALQLGCGIISVIGHVFPVYAGFRGGKGVATLLGLVLAFNTPVALACVGVFLCVFLITKYVSLGSMISGVAYPIFLMVPQINPNEPCWLETGFGIVVAILLIWTHKKNIGRLLKGEENKIVFSKKDKEA